MDSSLHRRVGHKPAPAVLVLPQRSRRRRRWDHVRRWALLLAGVPLLLLLLLPILALVVRTPPALLAHYLGSSGTVQAVGLSLGTSIAATLSVALLGTPLAHMLARRRFHGRRLLEALIDLPTVLPPAVAGLGLLMVFGRRGLLGSWLQSFGVEIAFTPLAVVLAQIFVAAPYYVKTASIGLTGVSVELEQAAGLDGAGPLQVFRHITLPLAWRSLIGGMALCWARALGEFGATIIFAGNYPGRTQTMPLAVYLGFEIELEQALTLAVILLAFSFGILFTIRALLRDEAE
ncbi:MAG: molybdenum ABC transporter permease [Herpetosiphonaceae bacterium]|nr:MAG: molybdenum ABC transporter permease [Herpetosiphonaceae bacterium]